MKNPGGIAGDVMVWHVPGIKIDVRAVKSLPLIASIFLTKMRSSTSQRVELKRVSFKSTGLYRCEVTAKLVEDNVLKGFDMRELVRRLTVIGLKEKKLAIGRILPLLELPSSPPKITGGDMTKEYHPGDFLNLTCQSEPSNPPSKLKWKLNFSQVKEMCKLMSLSEIFLY